MLLYDLISPHTRYLKTVMLSLLMILCPAMGYSQPPQPADIPGQYGEHVTATCSEGNRLVYHIQDAHCQPEAQYNIANIIEHLLSTYGEAVVALEGAAGSITADNFRAFPDKQALRDVSKHFLQNGTISGSEYLYITRKKPFLFIGAEDESAYLRNHRAMLDTIKQQPAALDALTDLIDTAQQKAQTSLTADQYGYTNNWIAYYTHTMSLEEYAMYLISVLKEHAIDTAQYDALVQFQKLIEAEQHLVFRDIEDQRLSLLDRIVASGNPTLSQEILTLDLQHKLYKVSEHDYFAKIASLSNQYDTNGDFDQLRKYADFLHTSSTFDKTALEQDMRNAIDQTTHAVFSSENSAELFALLQSYHRYRELVRLTINERDFTIINRADSLLWLKEKTKSLTGNSSDQYWEQLNSVIESAMAFYELTKNRDAHMVETLLDEMDRNNVQVGILIAGGFHKKGIQQMLADKEVSCCTITPVIRTLADTRYMSLIQNQKTAFEQYVGGSALALASWIADTPLGDPTIKTARTRVFSAMLTGVSIQHLAPQDLRVIKTDFEKLLNQAQDYLGNWIEEYSPELELTSIDKINNKLFIELNIAGKPVALIFSNTASVQNQFEQQKKIVYLDSLRIGNTTVDVGSGEMIDAFRSIAAAGKKFDQTSSQVPELLERLRLQDTFSAGRLKFSDLFNEYHRNQDKLSSTQITQLYETIVFLVNAMEMPTIQTEAYELERYGVRPADLFAFALDIVKATSGGQAIIQVNELDPHIRDVLQNKAISHISVDANMPFESVVVSLFDIIFTSPTTVGVHTLGLSNQTRIQSRVVVLQDGRFFVRFVAARKVAYPMDYTYSAQLAPLQDIFNPVRNGFLVVEKDGTFISATCALPDTNNNGTIEGTNLTSGTYDLPSGQYSILSLVTSMKTQALTHGIVLRGVLYRDEDSSFQLFATPEEFIESYSRQNKPPYLDANPKELRPLIEEAVLKQYRSPYKALSRGNWAEKAGNLTLNEFLALSTTDSIDTVDVQAPHITFDRLATYIDIRGKNFLDISSQIGATALYAHLSGAQFAAGMNVSLPQQKAAREIAAYLGESAPVDTIDDNIRKPLKNLVMQKDGTSEGQLFFRVAALKEYEERTGQQISAMPPESLDFLIADPHTIPYNENSFDVVTALNLTFDAANVLKEAFRIVRPDGIVYFKHTSPDANTALIEQAISKLQLDLNQRITYTILADGIVRIHSKELISSLDDNIFAITQELQKGKTERRVPPQLTLSAKNGTVLEHDFRVIDSGPISDIRSFDDITMQNQLVFLAVTELFRQVYGSEFLDSIEKLSMEQGRTTPVALSDKTLRVDISLLTQPLLFFNELEYLLYRKAALQQVSAFTADPQEQELYIEVAARTIASQQLLSNSISQELEAILTYLVASADVSKMLGEFNYVQAEMIANEQEEHLNILHVVNQYLQSFARLPQYKNMFADKSDLRDNLMQGAIPEELSYSIVNMLHSVKSSIPGDAWKSRSAVSTIPDHLTKSIIDCDNISESIEAWRNFQPYLNRVMDTGQQIPPNLEELFSQETFGIIFRTYPQTGFYILTDILKTLLNDPLSPPDASFLTQMYSSELLNLIINIDTNMRKKHPYLLRGLKLRQHLIQSLPPSTWIGPRLHNAMMYLNDNQPYKMLTMQMETTTQTEFLEKLNILAADQQINDDDFILLKVNRSEPSRFSITIVGNTLGAIKEDLSSMAIGNVFERHPFAYSKEFNSTTRIIGPGAFSFSPQLQRFGGLGSEFIKNETVLFQSLGLSGTNLRGISHVLPVFKLYERELNAQVPFGSLLKSLDNFGTIENIAVLFYRIGILTKKQYNRLREYEEQVPKAKAILDKGLLENRLPNESFIQIITRKSLEWADKKTRLDTMVHIYKMLLESYPSILRKDLGNAFDRLEGYLSVPDYDRSYAHDSELAASEHKLFDSLDLLKKTLENYVRSNPNTEASKMIIKELYQDVDTSAAYSAISKYLETKLPIMDMNATIPDTLSPANASYYLRTITRMANSLSQKYRPLQLAHLMGDNDPLIELGHVYMRSTQSKAISRFLAHLAPVLLSETIDAIPVLQTAINVLEQTNTSAGEFISMLKKIFPFSAQSPYTTLRLSTFVGKQLISKAQEGKDLVDTINNMDSKHLAMMIDTLENFSMDRFSDILPQYIALANTDFLNFIDHILDHGTHFGRFHSLYRTGEKITLNPLNQEQFILPVDPMDSFFAPGLSYLEATFGLHVLFRDVGLDAVMHQGIDTGIPGNEYALRYGDLSIVVSPEGVMINPAHKLTDETMIYDASSLTNDKYISFSHGTPLLWRQADANQGFLYTGGIRMDTVNNTSRFFNISITSILTDYGIETAQRTYELKVPAGDMYSLYQELLLSDPTQTLKTISRFKPAFFKAAQKKPIKQYADAQKRYLNDILYQIISHMDPTTLLREREQAMKNFIISLPLDKLEDQSDPVEFRTLLPEQKDLLADFQETYFAQHGRHIDIDHQMELNESTPDMTVFLFKGIPVGWHPSNSDPIIGYQQKAPMPLELAKTLLPNEAYSPFSKQSDNKVDKLVTICNVTINQTGEFDVEWNEDIPKDTIDINMYLKELELALLNSNVTPHQLKDSLINIQLVQGHPRLGQRMAYSPDGSVNITLDIDAFRSYPLLQLVTRHEFDDHSGISGEIKALINDIYYFQGLSSYDRQEILDTLRSQNIDLHSFATILDESSTDPILASMMKIIDFVTDKKVYPGFHTAAAGMSMELIARNATIELDAAFAEHLIGLGYDPFDALIVITHPLKPILENFLQAYENITDLPQDSLPPENIFVDALLGNREGASVIADFFFAHPEFAVNPQFSMLFALFADALPRALIVQSANDTTNSILVQKMLASVWAHSQNMVHAGWDQQTEQYILTYEQSNQNIVQHYSKDGTLLNETTYECDDVLRIAPQAISEQCAICESMYGKLLDPIIHDIESILATAKSDDDLKIAIPALIEKISIVSDTDFYDSIEHIDYTHIPLSKRLLIKQFISDIVGSPLISAAGMVRFASKKEFDKAMHFFNESLKMFYAIRENLVRFRMIEKYYITISGNAPMIFFPQTLVMEANKPFVETSFAIQQPLMDQLNTTLQNAAANDMFAVYLTPNTSAATLSWLTQTLSTQKADQMPMISIISPYFTSSDVETLIAQSGIDPQSMLVIGSEIIAAQSPDQQDAPISLEIDDIIELIKQNTTSKFGDIVFLAADTDLYARLIQRGIVALPLPGIEAVDITAQPVSDHVEKQALLDQSL